VQDVGHCYIVEWQSEDSRHGKIRPPRHVLPPRRETDPSVAPRVQRGPRVTVRDSYEDLQI